MKLKALTTALILMISAQSAFAGSVRDQLNSRELVNLSSSILVDQQQYYSFVVAVLNNQSNLLDVLDHGGNITKAEAIKQLCSMNDLWQNNKCLEIGIRLSSDSDAVAKASACPTDKVVITTGARNTARFNCFSDILK